MGEDRHFQDPESGGSYFASGTLHGVAGLNESQCGQDALGPDDQGWCDDDEAVGNDGE